MRRLREPFDISGVWRVAPMTARRAQLVHEHLESQSSEHDQVACWCCCADCDFDYDAVTAASDEPVESVSAERAALERDSRFGVRGPGHASGG
jgi:hypothetical protein